MPDYSSMGAAGGQRDAITRALMNIAMPPPPTSMPQGAATMAPRVPGVQGPIVPAAGQGGMPRDPMAGTSPTAAPGFPGAPGQMGGAGGVQGPPLPGALPQSMPGAPGMGQAGLPQPPMPKTPNLVGQPLPITPPGSQMMPPGAGGQPGY